MTRRRARHDALCASLGVLENQVRGLDALLSQVPPDGIDFSLASADAIRAWLAEHANEWLGVFDALVPVRTDDAAAVCRSAQLLLALATAGDACRVLERLVGCALIADATTTKSVRYVYANTQWPLAAIDASMHGAFVCALIELRGRAIPIVVLEAAAKANRADVIGAFVDRWREPDSLTFDVRLGAIDNPWFFGQSITVRSSSLAAHLLLVAVNADAADVVRLLAVRGGAAAVNDHARPLAQLVAVRCAVASLSVLAAFDSAFAALVVDELYRVYASQRVPASAHVDVDAVCDRVPPLVEAVLVGAPHTRIGVRLLGAMVDVCAVASIRRAFAHGVEPLAPRDGAALVARALPTSLRAHVIGREHTTVCLLLEYAHVDALAALAAIERRSPTIVTRAFPYWRTLEMLAARCDRGALARACPLVDAALGATTAPTR